MSEEGTRYTSLSFQTAVQRLWREAPLLDLHIVWSDRRLNPASPPFQPPGTSTLLVNARGPVLLQTAIIKLFNPEEPRRSIEVRAILDTGSQQCDLALKCLEKRTMSVMTFGASDKSTQTLVRIGISTKYGQEQEMEFVCAPLICQPLTAQSIDLSVEKYRHLADIDLADSRMNQWKWIS